MGVKYWNGSAYVEAKSVKVWNGSSWVRRRRKYWNGSAWVAADEVNTYAATESRSFDDGINEDSTPVNQWMSETWIRQGSFPIGAAQYGPFYGTFFFGSGSGKPTELSSKTIAWAQIFLWRMTEGGSGDDPFVLYATTLTDVPGSGAMSPHGNVSGSGSTIATLGLNEGGWFTLPNYLAQKAVDGYCLAFYSGTSNYARLYGIESATYKPQMRIYYY